MWREQEEFLFPAMLLMRIYARCTYVDKTRFSLHTSHNNAEVLLLGSPLHVFSGMPAAGA